MAKGGLYEEFMNTTGADQIQAIEHNRIPKPPGCNEERLGPGDPDLEDFKHWNERVKNQREEWRAQWLWHFTGMIAQGVAFREENSYVGQAVESCRLAREILNQLEGET